MDFPRVNMSPNSCVDDVEARSREWMDVFLPHKHRVSLFAAEPWRYAALVMPDAPMEIVSLCADYFAWLIAFDDDVMETGGPRVMLESFYGFSSDDPIDPFTEVIDDIVRRGSAFKSWNVWSRMFRLAICDYISGCAAEMRFRCVGRVPSEVTYRSFRHQTIGIMPIISIAALQLESDDAAWFDEVCIAHSACVQAAFCCAWANDYYSRSRESDAGIDLFNIVSVKMAEMGCYEHEIRERVAMMFNVERHMLMMQLKGLGPLGRMLEQLVDGNTEWYATSRRYERALKSTST